MTTELHKMWNSYPSIKKELQQTVTLMSDSIAIPNNDVRQAIIELFNAGGKLLRPAYLLLFSEFGNKVDRKKTIALAAAIETLHTATLIHDDIIDKASTRRGVATLQSKFDTDVAVYAGDYLFIVCFKLLISYKSSLKSIELNTTSMENVLLGELGQMNDRYNQNVTIEQYIANISGKTAELFALSCFLGAYESGASLRISNKCRSIGKDIGLTFQIVDDILDYSQSENTLGKPVLEDVRQGVYSLPLICAMEDNKDIFSPILNKKEAMTTDDAQRIYDLVQQYNGVEKAYKLANKYTDRALNGILTLPNNKENTKQTIYTITQNILKRTH